MTYYLGVDLGTTFTSAASWRDGRIEMKNLGSHTAAIPSVVLLREDETILTGDAANRRAMTEPGRVAREFKRRLGDTTPIVVGGSPYSAEALMARLLQSVTNEVAEREGGPAAGIAITHPANWGEYKRDLLRQAVRLADLPDVTLLTEPEAAAIHYASETRVEVDQVVAVFDLGGGTFDAAVLRKTADGFEILGRPEGIERLGGIDFDAAVFAHVARSLGGALEELDEDDPNAVAAVARLRSECVAAKEALSSDTDTTIPVLLPNLSTEVRITRTEFENMIRPSLADSIGAMHRAIESAGVPAEQVDAVLLVGGSSRIPLVSQLVGSELGRPVAVDTHPKHAIALGAAVAAARSGGAVVANPETGPAAQAPPVAATPVAAAVEPTPSPAAPAPAPSTAEPATPASPASAASEPVPATPAPAPASPPAEQPAPSAAAPAPAEPATQASAAAPPGAGSGLPQDPSRVTAPSAPTAPESGGGDGGGSRKGLLIGIGAIALVAIIAVAALALGGGGDDTDDVATGTENEVSVDDDAAFTEDDTEEPKTDDGNDDEAADDASEEATPEPTATVEPTPEPTPPPDEVCDREQATWACLTSVSVVDGQIQATYDSEGFAPSFDSLHYHFYGNTRDETNAGSQGTDNPDWVVWDQPEFTSDFANPKLSLDQSDKLCVVLGDGAIGHQSVPGTGNCLPLE